jgi:hypothetical protein
MAVKKKFFADVRSVDLAVSDGPNREQSIALIAGITLIGFILASVFHYLMGTIGHLGYPYNTFLFLPEDQFNDFFNMIQICRKNNPYFETYSFVSNYYPFANVLFYLFSFASNRWLELALFSLPACALIMYFTVHYLKTGKTWTILTVTIIVFCSFPVLFCLDRGNIELWLFIFAAGFLICYQKNRTVPAALFLAMTISMKLYPGVFVILLLADKRWRMLQWTILFCIILTFVPLFFFHGGFLANFLFVAKGFKPYLDFHLLFGDNNFVLRGVSFLDALKPIFISLNWMHSIPVSLFIAVYFVIVMMMFGLIIAYIILIEKEFWKKVALLTIVMLLFPHISADYRLIHVLLIIFVFSGTERHDRHGWIFAIILGLLLVPKNYWIIPGITSDAGDISVSNLINPALLVWLAGLIIFDGLKAHRAFNSSKEIRLTK